MALYQVSKIIKFIQYKVITEQITGNWLNISTAEIFEVKMRGGGGFTR